MRSKYVSHPPRVHTVLALSLTGSEILHKSPPLSFDVLIGKIEMMLHNVPLSDAEYVLGMLS